MTSNKYKGLSYDPTLRNSYMSHVDWAVTVPIFEAPLSRRPGQPDIGAPLTAHRPQRAVVMPRTLRRGHGRDS